MDTIFDTFLALGILLIIVRIMVRDNPREGGALSSVDVMTSYRKAKRK